MRYTSGTFQLTATDLANHLGCKHLTQLDRQVALDEIKKPEWNDPALAVLAKRGEEHEAAYVEYLRKKALAVADLRNKPLEATIAAMQQGVDVITQARLSEDHWLGNADILLKVAGTSKFGNWSYEVQDTKLAQNTRASTILQLCLYTDLLVGLQGSVPWKMYVVKPGDDFPKEEFLFTDFRAYYRLIRTNFEQVMAGPALETYPEPVAQCDICRWWKQCDTRRHDDDHLSLVAGIRTLHRAELTRQNITTLEQYAKEAAPVREKPERGNSQSYAAIHDQAKIQWQGRLARKLIHKLLPIENGRGFCRLPQPNNGDVYFDIEGDPFFDRGGLEYLLGWACRDTNGTMQYQALWGLNKVEEKRAFGQFIDFIMARWKRYPDMYIYHYGIYEPAAIKRLTGRHGIKADEVDSLLRAERFIDLHAVIRESLRASVERYSLKDLEGFTSYERKIDLPAASIARRALECALELNETHFLPSETRPVVQEYNADDCLATEAIHQWLETLRDGAVASGQHIARPEVKTGEAKEDQLEIQTRARSLYEGLTEGLPEDRATWTDEHKAKWLLANQVDYFRRENNSAWWEYFRVHELDFEDLLDERKAITGLRFTGEVEIPGRRRNSLPIHRYHYPAQEVGLEVDDELHAVLGEPIGAVYALSLENQTIDIRKRKDAVGEHPVSVHIRDVVSPEPIQSALFDLAESVISDGMNSPWPYRAAKHLLMKKHPHLDNGDAGALLGPGDDIVQGAISIASRLKQSVLAIQGPPGTGKTHTGAAMILDLAAQGKRIGVTAVGHKTIRNLFDKVLALAAEKGFKPKLVHKAKDKSESLPEGLEEVDDNKKAFAALDSGRVVGGTAWLWASNDAREKLDYLFVDEAGQMSLAHVLAAARSAKNLVLLGDPQQLEQPQRGAHPEGADTAALTYLLDGHKTMPIDKGLFLNVTRRLHPGVSAFTSELFYEGRLASLPGLEKQQIGGDTQFKGGGLYYVPVDHSGNQNKSKEEIETVAKIVSHLVDKDVFLTHRSGAKRKLQKDDIVIVAPYNAQVGALREKLPGMRVGTVDKFQGQEAAVVIYSMTSSSPQDAPRGMGFLYNPNRFNVATSRAQCICILVASPRLLEPECHTIDQMRWTNTLCRYADLATVVKL